MFLSNVAIKQAFGNAVEGSDYPDSSGSDSPFGASFHGYPLPVRVEAACLLPTGLRPQLGHYRRGCGMWIAVSQNITSIKLFSYLAFRDAEKFTQPPLRFHM
jgi:hypothetical protein